MGSHRAQIPRKKFKHNETTAPPLNERQVKDFGSEEFAGKKKKILLQQKQHSNGGKCCARRASRRPNNDWPKNWDH